MTKRILLFILTNLLVMITISIVIHLFGVQYYLTSYGIDYKSLMIFCLLWGMGGSFVSLLMSKFMAKQAMGVQLIDPQTAQGQERYLLEKVYQLAKLSGIEKMPEVGIYQSNDPNAFATGPSKNNALVAISSGLLSSMRDNEVEGVLGHEISHVANGDMVTMMLIQGVTNAFALFLSRILSYVISIALSRDEENRGSANMVYYLLTFVFDILFTILGSLVVAAFSRWREFRADAGGAKLAGRENMVAALRRLAEIVSSPAEKRAPTVDALKISQPSAWMALFSTHPPLEERIKRLI